MLPAFNVYLVKHFTFLERYQSVINGFLAWCQQLIVLLVLTAQLCDLGNCAELRLPLLYFWPKKSALKEGRLAGSGEGEGMRDSALPSFARAYNTAPGRQLETSAALVRGRVRWRPRTCWLCNGECSWLAPHLARSFLPLLPTALSHRDALTPTSLARCPCPTPAPPLPIAHAQAGLTASRGAAGRSL